MTIDKIKALEALKAQHEFIRLLSDCGDADRNPLYYTGQVEQLRGMRDMFDVVFGDAPFTYAACLDMLSEA